MNIRYVELVDYLAIATEITGLDTSTLLRVTKIELAESALHAPAAAFGLRVARFAVYDRVGDCTLGECLRHPTSVDIAMLADLLNERLAA